MLRRPASLAVDLAFLRGVDAAETDALGVMIAPDFERVAVEDPDHFGGGICRDSDAGKKDVIKTAETRNMAANANRPRGTFRGGHIRICRGTE